jgi:hypothetical protein
VTSNTAGSNLAFLELRATDFEVVMNRLWAEFFGLIRLVVVVAFTLFFQCIRFLTWLNKRLFLLPALIVGTESWGPTLWVLYEGYFYPLLVVSLSLVKAGTVFLRIVGDATLALVAPVIGIVRAFRLVEVTQNYHVPAAKSAEHQA